MSRVANRALLARRMMSGGHSFEEGVASVQRWKWISLGCVAVIGIKFFTVMVLGDHEHVEMRDDLEYTHIRHKPFPFKDGDTGLFETKHAAHKH